MGIAGESVDAVIRLRVLRLDPLTGTAVSETGAELGFEGWMELIGAVANLIGSPDRPDIVDQRAASMSSEQRIEP
jgi:hypothetical protein